MNINITIKRILEALLMSSFEPISLDKLYTLLVENGYDINKMILKNILQELMQDYSVSSIELVEVASGYRLQVKSEWANWIGKLREEKPPRYSKAFLETLAIIAYKQPITRAEIEEIRGVTINTNVLKTLIEHEWVKVVGYKETAGKPSLYGTTKKFLDYFNLKSLSELLFDSNYQDKINM